MSDAMSHRDASSFPGAHLNDSALVELLDGELDEADRDPYDRHLVECTNFAARLTELRTISQLLSDTHRAIDVPPGLLQRPPRRVGARQPWRSTRRPDARSVPRVAALVFFVALAAAASRPVRAAVLQLTRSLWSRSTVHSPPSRGVASPSPADRAEASTHDARVAFTPVGPEIILDFDAPWTPGALRLMRGTSDTAAVVEVHAAQFAPDLVVLPGSVRFRNASDLNTRYRVVVPRSTERVLARVGGSIVAQLAVARLPADRDTLIEANQRGRTTPR
jgi:anti-sigma factor RsiW